MEAEIAVIGCAISFTAVYLVSVTGKHSVKESFFRLCLLKGETVLEMANVLLSGDEQHRNEENFVRGSYRVV